MSVQNIATVLLRNPQLRQLCTQAGVLTEAQACLERALPAEILSHCRVAAIQGDTLTLHAETPAWAAKLRYLGPGFLNELQRNHGFSTIRTIRIRTVPEDPPAIRKTPRPLLSADTVQLLRDVAESVQDPALRASLLRLSRR